VSDCVTSRLGKSKDWLLVQETRLEYTPPRSSNADEAETRAETVNKTPS